MSKRFYSIGVLSAIGSEVKPLLLGLGPCNTEDYAGVRWHVGQRAGRRLVAGISGVGKVNAASAAQALIDHFKVDAVMFCGIAGGMSPGVRVGDVVIGKHLCHHDVTDEQLVTSAPYIAEYTADPLLCDAAGQGCRLTGARYMVGRIATGECFVGDPALKRAIVSACHPDAVEMEGAAVAQVAMRNTTPFLVLRAISDNADLSEEALGGDDFDEAPFAQTAAAALLATIDALQTLDG